jgi:hypothetical protein
MRPQQCGRHWRGNLEGVPPGEIWGLWIAQASNRRPRAGVVEICTAIGVKPWFVPDEVRLCIPDVLWSIGAGKAMATLLSRANRLKTEPREWRCRS